jgi:hypothetical protein
MRKAAEWGFAATHLSNIRLEALPRPASIFCQGCIPVVVLGGATNIPHEIYQYIVRTDINLAGSYALMELLPPATKPLGNAIDLPFKPDCAAVVKFQLYWLVARRLQKKGT